MNRIRNGQWVEHDGPEMAVLASGVPGAFETLLLRGGELVFWTEHWQRFEAGMQWYGLRAPVDTEAMRNAAAAVAAKNHVRDGVLRYAAWQESGGSTGWQVEVSGPRPAMRKPALRLTWGPMLDAPGADRAFKHLSRTRWAAAAREAHAGGFDQPLLTDGHGHVVEAATANVFVARRGTLLTPPLRAGPLPGIVRAHVLAVAREAGVHVAERQIARADVESADEVWLTNSLIGIRPVIALDGHAFAAERPVLERIRAAWRVRHGWDPTAGGS